ncbi:MAG: hypothetical protein ACXVRX_05930 [Solirubrobacteraceae bacterium]
MSPRVTAATRWPSPVHLTPGIGSVRGIGSRRDHPIWSDTRSEDVFLCPGSAVPGTPPALCGATEPNGEVANDEDTFSATVNVPSGNGH